MTVLLRVLAGAMLCAAAPREEAPEARAPAYARVEVDGTVRALAYSPDGRHLAARIAGPGGETLRIYGARPPKLRFDIGLESVPGPAAIAFSPNSRFVAAGYRWGIRLWAVRTGSLIRTLAGDTPGGSVAVDDAGRRAASAGGQWAEFFDVAAGKRTRKLTLDWKKGEARAVAFGRSGLAVAGTFAGGARVELFETESGSATKRFFELPQAEFLAADYRPLLPGEDMIAPTYLAVGGCRKGEPDVPFVKVLDGKLKEVSTWRPEGSGCVVALRFQPRGDRLLLVVRSDSESAELWNWSGKLVRRLEGVRVEREGAAAFSPDGRAAAVGGSGEIRVWEAGEWDR